MSVIDPNGAAPAAADLTAAPAIVETAPVAAPAVETPAAPAEPAYTPHSDTPSLLSTIKAPGVVEPEPAAPVVAEEAKPGEAPKPAEAEAPKQVEGEKPADPAKPGEAEPVEVQPVAVEPVAYTDFAIPEGFAVVPEKIEAFKGLVGKFGVPQDVAQELIGMHTAVLTEYAGQTLRNQHQAFADYRATLRSQVMSDDELGGAGHQTTMAAVARARDRLVPADRMDAFNDMLNVTGVGDHPEFLRLLHRASRLLDEPALPQIVGRPAANNGKPPGPSRLRDVYRKGD